MLTCVHVEFAKHIFIFYKEIQTSFNICHGESHKHTRCIYYISNQAIYSIERVGSIRPSFDCTSKVRMTLRALCAFN